MKKLWLLCLPLLLVGCASLNYRIVGWSNIETVPMVRLSNGEIANIVGNPRITCFNGYGLVIADGYFVTVQDNFLIVDEFGTDYAYVSDNGHNTTYCTLWERN